MGKYYKLRYTEVKVPSMDEYETYANFESKSDAEKFVGCAGEMKETVEGKKYFMKNMRIVEVEE